MRTRKVLLAAGLMALSASAFACPMKNNDAMRHSMQRMQEQMKQFHAATDPKERQRLMEEHMKAMSEAMPMMTGMTEMKGCPMMQQKEHEQHK